VIDYSHGKRYDAVNGPEGLQFPARGRPFYESEADLILKASARLDALGWEHGDDVVRSQPLPTQDKDGKIRRSIIYLDFCDKPHGFKTDRGGNTALIGLDSLTGEIVELQRFIGYRYGPPTVRISAGEALQKAGDTIELDPKSTVRGPVYRDLTGMGTRSARGQRLMEDKQLDLAYVVEGPREFAFVAADTGEVLYHGSNLRGGEPPKPSGGAAGKSAQKGGSEGTHGGSEPNGAGSGAPSDATAGRSPAPDNGPPWGALAGTAGGVVLIGVAAYWIARRR
jgi:hypothetical protein